jgi:hypothetical protein
MSFKITAESDLWESRGTFTLAFSQSFLLRQNISLFSLGCPFIRHICVIQIMNNFGLLFEYSNNIRIFILLCKLLIFSWP